MPWDGESKGGQSSGRGDSKDETQESESDLRFGLVVTALVGPCVFRVPVGEGLQTVKWLGLVASQRYAAHVQANGKQRQREKALLEAGNYLPVCVKRRGVALEPHTTVRDALSLDASSESSSEKATLDNSLELELEVELCLKVRLGKDGAPALQEWQANAFCHSDAGKRHVQAQRVQLGLAKAQEGDGDGDGDGGGDDGGAWRGKHGKYLAPGFHTHFDGPEKVAFEMEQDWTFVKELLGSTVEAWFAGNLGSYDADKEQEAKTLLLNEMESLCHLMDFYSWTWRHEEGDCRLSVVECRHMLHHCGLVDLHNRDVDADVSQWLAKALAGSTVVLRYHVMFLVLAAAASFADVALPLGDLERLLAAHVRAPAAALRSAEKHDPVRKVLSKSTVARVFRGPRVKDEALARALSGAFRTFCLSCKGTEGLSMTLQELGLFCTDALPANVSLAASAAAQSQEQSQGQGQGQSGTRQRGEAKAAGFGKADAVDRMAACRDIFTRAQQMVPGSNSKAQPLDGLVLSEFVMALLHLLKDCDAVTDVDADADALAAPHDEGKGEQEASLAASGKWDPGAGARAFLELAEHLQRTVPEFE